MPAKWHKYSYSAQQAERKGIISVLLFLIAFSLIYFLITHFAVTMLTVDSNTMQPTLASGDCIVATPFYRKFSRTEQLFPPLINPQRGDLVIIAPAHPHQRNIITSAVGSFISFISFQRFQPFNGDNPRSELPIIRRIIGFPGDTLYMEDFIVHIKPAGSEHFLTEFELSQNQYNLDILPLPENWTAALPFSASFPEMKLTESEYFVLTDNRITNGDSRIWGPIQGERLGGKVFFRYWPVSGVGRL